MLNDVPHTNPIKNVFSFSIYVASFLIRLEVLIKSIYENAFKIKWNRSTKLSNFHVLAQARGCPKAIKRAEMAPHTARLL